MTEDNQSLIQKKVIIIVTLIIIVVSSLMLLIDSMNKSDALTNDDTPSIDETQNDESVFDNDNSNIQYSDFKNYNIDNHDRYIQYHSKNSELLDADVIWRVNMNLDVKPYSHKVVIDKPEYYFSIVNKNLSLPEDYVPQDLVNLDSNDNVQVRFEVNQQYHKMLIELDKLDLNLAVSSGYESYGENPHLEDDIRAGHSEHQLGLVIDVYDPEGDQENFNQSDVYHWLKQNAHRFGFIFRYDEDSDIIGYDINHNHLRFIGIDSAVDMHEKNISLLEEYVNKYTDFFN